MYLAHKGKLMSNNEVLSLDLDNPNQPTQQQNGPVECLGKTFENDQARREHYLAILTAKLKDPEFRKIEGFPIGEDEDILNLSDPPYYTACPNPFIEDFFAFYGHPYDPNEKYKREPYAADVSEGKNDPIYNAHSYHTKVPHKAIMRYILHYTNPGDLVFDGFCGTGMTGVAAQLCGDIATIESLGYRVLTDGTILQENKNTVTQKLEWVPFSKLGTRRAILNDLSTAATFIAYNYNNPVDISDVALKAKKIISEVESECGWMFETHHLNGEKGRINHLLWSDVFNCSSCANEIVFWDAAVEYEKGNVKKDFHCPQCNILLTKNKLEKVWTTIYDDPTQTSIKQAKQVPVLINYTLHGKRYEKKPDQYDLDLIEQTNTLRTKYWFPVVPLPNGFNTLQPKNSHGITHVHLFYPKSGLIELAAIWHKSNNNDRSSKCIQLAHTASSNYVSRMRRFRPDKKGGGPLAGTLYVGALTTPPNPILTFERNVNFITKAFKTLPWSKEGAVVSCQSTTDFKSIASNSLDYIFIDPPFGSNLNYSELNILWEAWLKVRTNNEKEAIENKIQEKGANEYRQLMTQGFKEAYRILKPGRWMTVEFSNTSSSVWNNIQTALNEAGFLISNVSALNKKQGSFKAITTPTAVKQDLVISAYKPNGGFEDRFIIESNEDGLWDFIRTHLGYLSIIKRDGAELVKVPERDPRILFDQVIAYFVRNMRDVPLSSREFQDGLQERFSERDGMIFLPEQVAQYDKARMTSIQLRQLSIFVDDEASAIEWLRQLLTEKPQTYQDIHPKFINELSGWKKAEMQLELMKLLEQNFLKFNGQGLVPAQIHSYLSTNFKELRGLEKDDPQLLKKAKDRWFVPDPNNEEQLQALRDRDLLKQFEEYKAFVGKKIKLVRLEAVRAGFKKAWQDREYGTIIQVAEKIPDNLLQEDQKLLMWYDQAQTRYSDSNLF